jgi:hypothetical protein
LSGGNRKNHQVKSLIYFSLPRSFFLNKVSAIFVSLFLLAGSFNAKAEAIKPRIHNYANDFQKFWDESSQQSDKQKIADLKKNVFAKFPAFYDWKIAKWKEANKDPDTEILKHLKEYESHQKIFAEKNQSISSQIDADIASFLKIFPDFNQDIDIYIVHSFGDMDGGTRKINNKVYFIFGIDGMVKYHEGFKSEVPFFHHELFHQYHNRFLVDKNEIWVSLWAEGLATYVSEALSPGSSIKELMLDTPPGMYEACKKVERNLWPQLVKDQPYTIQNYGIISRKDESMTKSRFKNQNIDIDALFIEGHLIDQAINDAVKKAVERHKKLSQPIVVWKDGKVVTIDPQDIDKEVA